MEGSERSGVMVYDVAIYLFIIAGICLAYGVYRVIRK